MEVGGYFGGSAAGGFEEEELLLGVVEGYVAGGVGYVFDIEFGSLFEGQHDRVVEIVAFAPFEGFDGSKDIVDREPAGGVLADECLCAVLEGLKYHSGYLYHAFVAVAFVGERVVETAGEHGDFDVGIFLMDTVGDEKAAGGFALELDVEEQVVGQVMRHGAVESGEQLCTVGIGIHDRHLAVVNFAIVVHAARHGVRLAIEF